VQDFRPITVNDWQQGFRVQGFRPITVNDWQQGFRVQGFRPITVNDWQKGFRMQGFRGKVIRSSVGFAFREYQLVVNHNHINKAEMINNKLEKIPAWCSHLCESNRFIPLCTINTPVNTEAQVVIK
jgi:hypothetical protein